jgi:hypothetical protein
MQIRSHPEHQLSPSSPRTLISQFVVAIIFNSTNMASYAACMSSPCTLHPTSIIRLPSGSPSHIGYFVASQTLAGGGGLLMDFVFVLFKCGVFSCYKGLVLVPIMGVNAARGLGCWSLSVRFGRLIQ